MAFGSPMFYKNPISENEQKVKLFNLGINYPAYYDDNNGRPHKAPCLVSFHEEVGKKENPHERRTLMEIRHIY